MLLTITLNEKLRLTDTDVASRAQDMAAADQPLSSRWGKELCGYLEDVGDPVRWRQRCTGKRTDDLGQRGQDGAVEYARDMTHGVSRIDVADEAAGTYGLQPEAQRVMEYRLGGDGLDVLNEARIAGHKIRQGNHLLLFGYWARITFKRGSIARSRYCRAYRCRRCPQAPVRHL